MKSRILRKRIFAFLLDYLIYFTVSIFYVIYFGNKGHEGTYSVNGLKALPVFFILVTLFYHYRIYFKSNFRTLSIKSKSDTNWQ